jgi:hypothetical protein
MAWTKGEGFRVEGSEGVHRTQSLVLVKRSGFTSLWAGGETEIRQATKP